MKIKRKLSSSEGSLNNINLSMEYRTDEISKEYRSGNKKSKAKLTKKERNNLRGKNKRSTTRNVGYYFNHKHLQEAISGYGYTMTTPILFQYYCYAAIVGYVIASIYKMPLWSKILTIIIAIITSIHLILNKYYNLYQIKRFDEANKYIEKMLSSFKRSHKIYESLLDVKELFPENDMMYDVITKAIDTIKTTQLTEDTNDSDNNYDGLEEDGDENYDNLEEYNDGKVLSNEALKKKALSYISKAYNCRRINTLHNFLIIVEKNGGNCDTYIDVLLQDRALWDARCNEAQIERNHTRTLFFVSIIFASLLCAIPFYMSVMFGDNFKMINISEYIPVIIGSLIYITYSARFLAKTDKKFCTNWLDDVKEVSLKSAQKDYHQYIEFDPKEGMTKSLIIAAITGTIFIGLYCLVRSFVILLIGLVIALMLLRIHEIHHKLLYKILKKQIEIAVPFWIMNVALLLQSRGVRTAIKDSYDDAPNILKPALNELILGLEAYPDDRTSYDLFLQEFGIKEVSECMTTLYTIANGTVNDYNDALMDVVKNSNILMDRSESLRNKDKTAVFKLAISTPPLYSSFKLMFDLSVFLLSFMTNLSV